MNEENAKDPRDLNGDGKVTLNEKITYMANEASEKLEEVAKKAAEEAKVLADKADVKLAEAKVKANEFADKASASSTVSFSKAKAIGEELYFDLIICDEAHRTTGVTLKGDDESAFVRVHDNAFIRARKRMYMTATPRLYKEADQKRAQEQEALYQVGLITNLINPTETW